MSDYSLRDQRPSANASEGKLLTVGRGIRLQGEITDCEKLVVEGTVEAELSDAESLFIANGGLFKGAAKVEVAEIEGRFEGSLVVTSCLTVRDGGTVDGDITYADIEVERGARILGSIKDYLPASPAQSESLESEDSAPIEEDPSEQTPASIEIA